MKLKCAITGANGYVGSCIKKAFQEQKDEVYELTRTKAPGHIPFSLEEGVSPQHLKGLDVLVHCAYDFRASRWTDIERINIEGSKRLLRSAAEARIQTMILISTQSAFEGCKSMYGKAKLAIEKMAKKYDAIIIRPGLVYEEKAGGMVGSLNKISRLPLIPLIGHGKYKLFATHQKDLSKLVTEAAHKEFIIHDPIIAAHEEAHSFKDILTILRKASGKSPAPFVSLPSSVLWALLRVAEIIRVPLGLRSDSITSLIYQNPNPNFEPTRKTQIAFRPFSAETLKEAV